MKSCRSILPLSFEASGDALVSSESGSSEPHGKAARGEVILSFYVQIIGYNEKDKLSICYTMSVIWVATQIFIRGAQGSDGPTTFLPGLKGLLHPFIQTNEIETSPSSASLFEDTSTRLKAYHQSCQGLRPVSMNIICETSNKNGEGPVSNLLGLLQGTWPSCRTLVS